MKELFIFLIMTNFSQSMKKKNITVMHHFEILSILTFFNVCE